MMIMAKLCGEDNPNGIAEWVKHRAEEFVDMLKLKCTRMPHHSTYRRIEEEVVNPEELEEIASRVLSEKKYYGKQALLLIDGKVLRGTLDESQNGTYLLAAYLPQEGVVLMEISLNRKGSELPGTVQLLKLVDLREKVVMGMLCIPKEPCLFKLWRPVATISGSQKATNRNWKRTFGFGLSLFLTHFLDRGDCAEISRPSSKPAKDTDGWKSVP